MLEMEGWGPDGHNGRGPAWPAPQRSVVLPSSIRHRPSRPPAKVQQFAHCRRALSDRPTSKFVPLWSQGTDSFLKDNPNATLSVFHGDKVSNLVVELSNPRLSGNDLSYDIKVLEGTLLARGGACALFIDVIGMPLTPYSYAGATREGLPLGPTARAYRY